MKVEPDLLKKVTIPELEFPESTVGYPEDIVRDPVVTIHGQLKKQYGSRPCVIRGTLLCKNIVTDLALRISNIVIDLAFPLGNNITDLVS